jgi:hypothetical protein
MDGAEMLYYDGTANLLALEGNMDFNSSYHKNPIVIFVNIDESAYPRVNTGDNNIGSNQNFTMYRMSKEALEIFGTENNPGGYDVQIFSANIGDQFQYRWGILRKTLYINTFIGILLIFLNFLITIVTTRLDYSVNAIELALKKTVGYSLLERHRKLLYGSAVCSFAAIIGAVIISLLLRFSGIGYVIGTGLLFLGLDLAAITKIVHRAEHARIPMILKGGAL